MVKLMRTPPALGYYKTVYGESLGKKIKTLWSAFQDSNPVLAYFGPTVTGICATLTVIEYYLKKNQNPVPRYYDYFVIYRPDDPRVKLIRKGNSLSLGTLMDYPITGYEDI